MIPTDPQEAYNVGHREGESCRDADWTIALDDVWPDDEDCTPEAVAAALRDAAATRSALRQLADEEPVVYNSDRGYTTCAYCADYYEDDDHHNDKPHSSDCPWLAARVLVSDVSTQETTP